MEPDFDIFGTGVFKDLELHPVTLTQLDLMATQTLVKVEGLDTGFKTTNQTGRFSEPLTTSDFQQTLKSRIPRKTQQANSWAVKVFTEWRIWRSGKYQGETVWPIPGLEDGTLEALDFWLARFITEIKWKDGSPYQTLFTNLIVISVDFTSV